MGQAVTLELSPEALAGLTREATSAGVTVDRLLASLLERRYAAPRPPQPGVPPAGGGVERFFGCFASGRSDGADNEAIDADLAREYSRTGWLRKAGSRDALAVAYLAARATKPDRAAFPRSVPPNRRRVRVAG
jgi:hypothetical protein